MPRKPIITSAALVLIAGFLVLFLGGGARFAVGLTLRPIVDDLAWGRSDLGLAVALFQVVSAAAMFAAGHLAGAERRPSRQWPRHRPDERDGGALACAGAVRRGAQHR